MKLLLSFISAISLNFAGTAFATDYAALAAQGYRWVIANGPYACSKGKTSTELSVITRMRLNLTWCRMLAATT
jgi:hypothetical protein